VPRFGKVVRLFEQSMSLQVALTSLFCGDDSIREPLLS